jgi:hypothetical protein
MLAFDKQEFFVRLHAHHRSADRPPTMLAYSCAILSFLGLNA